MLCELKGGRDHIKKAGKTGGNIPRGHRCMGGIFTEDAENEVPQKKKREEYFKVFSRIREGKFGWSIGYHMHRKSGSWKVKLMPYCRSI